MPNITEIIPPRVPLVDARTGMIAREWYRFFFNQFQKLGGGGGVIPPDSGGTGTATIPLIGQILIGNASGTYTVASLTAGVGLFRINGDGSLTVGIDDTGVAAGSYGSASSVAEFTVNDQGQLTAATDTAIEIDTSQITSGTLDVVRGGTGQSTYTDGQLLIGNSTGNTLDKSTLTAGIGIAISNGPGAITIATSGISVTSAPVTKVADFTVASTDTWIINNKSGSTCTATLPAPATNTGRVLYFQNYQSQFLVSASSNVVPKAGGAASTAILADEAGDTATLVSDGTNWITMQYTPNNILLLE
jgi:hypothetical protein